MAVQMQQTRPTTESQWGRALDRALSEGLDVLVEPISGEAFVESATRPGTLYAVSAFSCSCPAGQRGIPCKHRACYMAQIGVLALDPEPDPAGPALAPIASRPCFWCNGSGRVPNDYEQCYDACSACAGTGTKPTPQPQPRRIAA